LCAENCADEKSEFPAFLEFPHGIPRTTRFGACSGDFLLQWTQVLHEAGGGANLTATRRLTLSLLRQDSSLKRDIKVKRFACALDPKYLLQIFQQLKNDVQALAAC